MSLKAIAICAYFHLNDHHQLDIKKNSIDLICQHAEAIVQYSEKNNIVPELVLTLMWSESRFQENRISNKGACGLMQVIPKWASNNQTCDDLKIPLANIQEGTRMLNFWINEYGNGKEEKGLCGYAAGYKCKVSNKAKRYAKSVIKKSKKLSKELSKLMLLLSDHNNFKQLIQEKYKL